MTHLMNMYSSSFRSVYLQIHQIMTVGAAVIHLHCVNYWLTIHVMSRQIKRDSSPPLISCYFLDAIFSISLNAVIS